MKQTFQILFLVTLCVCYSNKNFGYTPTNANSHLVEHFVGDEDPNLPNHTRSYLSVNDPLATPVISLTGSNCEGSSIILSVPAYEGTSVSYKWEFYGELIEHNHPRLFFQELDLEDAGLYRVTVEVDACSATSEDYSLVVFTSPTTAIAPIDPSDVNCPEANSNLILDATVSGGTGVYTYEWTGPNGYISTEEDATITNVTPDKTGTYSIVTTDSRGCTHEPVRTEVEVTEMPDTPTITSTGGTCAGGTIELRAGNASTVQPFTWTRDDIVLDNTTNRLTIENLTPNDSGNYRVSVGGEGCEAISSPFVLNIPELPTVEVPNYPKFECTDGNSELTLSATGRGGSGGYQYVWSGPNEFFAMTRRPVLTSLSAEDAGIYEVFVEDSNGCISEVSTIELEVTDAVDLPLLMTSGPACIGGDVTFSVAEYTGSNVSYNWIKNGQMLAVTTRQFQLTELDEDDLGDYQVRVTVDGCSAVSPKYLLEIFEPPVAILNDMPDEMRCATGTESYTFDLETTEGTPPYIYRWSGPNNFRSTLQNPTLRNLSASKSGVYSVVVRDQNGCTTTNVSTRLTIQNAPAQPVITANGNFCTGGNVTLRTPAYTGSSVSYQWMRNGTVLTNAGNVLSLNNVTQDVSGNYELTVTVDNCMTTSDPYVLMINENPSVNIDTPPSFDCTNGSDSHTFTATASGGTGDYTYSWQGANGFNSTLENPTINNLSEANAGIYTLTVRDANRCNSNTASAELEVSGGVAQANITANDPVCAGENVVLSIPAYSEFGVTYTWFFNGERIATNNSPQLIIENSTTADVGDYVVVASFNGCETPTEPYTLTVNRRPSVTIAQQNELNCIEEDSELRFNATVNGTNGLYTYDWRGPNNFTSSQEDPILTNLSTASAGTYTLVVTDVNGCNSPEASTEVVIAQALPQPVIRLAGKVCVGENITLSVQDYPEDNIIYSWIKDGVDLENDNNELIINNLQESDVADYTVIVSRNECGATSAPFPLIIQSQPAVSIDPVQDLTCTSGRQTVQINANVTGGDGNYTYEWIGPNGFRSSDEDPIIDNIKEENSGTYTLAVTDGSACGAVRSSVQITVTGAIDVPIITANGARCPGEQTVLRVQDYGGSNVNYTWSHNGNILPNTGNILTINSVRLVDAGNYYVTVTQNGCSEISDAYNLVVNNRPTVSIANVAPMNCTGGSNNITLNSTATGGGGDYNYAWSGPNNYQSTQDDPQIVNVTSRESGTYQLIVTDGNGCQSNPTSVVIDITDGIDEPIIVAEGGLCEGARMTLSVAQYSGTGIGYEWRRDGELLEARGNILTIDPMKVSDSGNYSVRVTADGCFSISEMYTLNVRPRPTASIENVGPVNCTSGNNNITLDAIVEGNEDNYTYLWTGPNGYQSTQDNPQIVNATSDESGTYQLIVTDENGCQSNPISVVLDITNGINEPIITQTGSTCIGQQLILSVAEYTGTGIGYEWRRGSELLEARGNRVVIDRLSANDSGIYSVRVTADGCSATSEFFTLNVKPRPTASIENIAPINCTGGSNNLTLNSTVEGDEDDYIYSWTGPNDYESGQNDPQIVNVTSEESGTYQLIVTDLNGCESNPTSIVVDITDGINEPIIAIAGSTCEGQSLTLSVPEYTGTGIGYEWRRGSELLESRGNTVMIDRLAMSDSGIYSVRVTADGCSATSEFFTLNVKPRPTASIENIAPINCTGGSNNLTLNSTVEGDEDDYIYSWTGPNDYESGQNDPQIVNVTSEESGTYQLIVTDLNGCESNPTSVVVDITDGINEPIIATVGSTCEGQNLTLSVPEYVGTGISYEWRRGSELLEARGNVVTLDPLTSDDSGNYSVRVTANGCAATSEIYALNVKPRPIVGIEDVQSMNCTGTNTDITLNPIIAGGTGQYTYAWTGPNGFQSTQVNPTIVNATSDKSGVYQLIVTDVNGCNSATESVSVDITDGISQPIITASSNVCEGESLTLSVPQYAGSGITYEWFHNGAALEASGNELIIAPVLNTSNGNYVVNVKANGCDAVSETYILNARPRPTVEIDNVPPMNCATGINNMTLNSTVTGGSGNYTYSWTGPNGFASTQDDPQIVNLESSKAGTYQVVVTDVNGCTSRTESVVVDITDAIPTPIINTSDATCDGGQMIIEVQAVQGSFVNYEWITPNGTTENISGLNTNRIIISPVDASTHEGNYRVLVEANGCQSRSEVFELKILSQPTASPRAANGLVCNGDALELFANASAEGDLTYHWEGPNGFVSNLPNPVINNATTENNGDYMLQVSNGSGCTTMEMLTVNRVKAALARPFITTNSPICMGEELQLSANTTATSFEWISPLGEAASAEMESLNTISSSTSYMPESQAYISGIWYVRSVDAEGCRSALSDPIEISITDTPEAIANKSSDVCPGESVQLFANEMTGANYEWRLAGGGAIISTQANPTIQNIGEDTSFGLTVIQNGCPSREAIITVNAQAVPEAAPIASYRLNSDCAPSDLRLLSNAAPEEGWTYNWTGPNGFTSSVADPIIVNADSDNNGAYELTITTATGCSATYVTNVISSIADEIAQPIIAGSGPACEGESITLTGPMYESAELTYNWIYEGRRISGEGSNQLIVNELSEENAGSYRMIVEANGCVLTSNSYEVTIKTQPTITPAYNLSNNCEGATLELMANAQNASSYEWSGPNGFTSSSFNSTIPNTSVANNGGYSITAIAANGCSTTESILIEDIEKTPSQPTILTANNICAGGDITLQVAENYSEASDFIWINNGGQVLGNENLITLSSNDPAAQGPYRVRVAENGCFSGFSEPYEVNIVPAPIAIITYDNNVCLGSDVQVFASGVTNATYEWRHAFSRELLSTEQNPTFFGLEDDLPLQLQVKVAGCTEVAEATTRLELNEAPKILRVVGNNEVCENSRVTLSTSLTNGGGQDIIYDWTGPNGFNYTATVTSGTPASLVLANVTTSMSGSYTVTATAENGCVSNTESILVEVSPVPDVPTISAIETALCQGNELQLNATPYSDSNVLYEWMFNDGTFPVTLNITSEPTLFLPNVSPENTGNYSVRILSSDCDSGTSNSVAVNVSGMIETPQALNSSSFDIPACAGEAVTLTLPFIENATYQWYGPNGFTSTLPNPVIDAVSATSAGDYFAVLNLNDCATIISEVTTVYVNPTPTAPTITSDAPVGAGVCFGDNITLRVSSTLDLLPNDIVSFAWYNALTDELLGTTESSTFELENVTRSGDYYVVMTLNNCATARSTPTTVEIVGVPDNVSAFAGQDQSICATTEATLFAIDNAPGMGLWTSLGDATIINPTDATANAIGLGEGENKFVWSLSTGSCGVFSVDTVSITVGTTPVDFAMAGEDVNVCGGNETTLNATVPTEANGRWTQPSTQISEGVMISDPNDPTTAILGLKEGNTYSFTWSLSMEECLNYQSDEVIVKVSATPLSIAFIEEDEVFACADENVILQANTPQAATGVWTTTSDATIIEAGSPKSLVADLSTGASTFIWTLSNEACNNYSSDTLIVYSEGIPVPEPDFYSVMFNEAIEEVDLLENDDLGGVKDYEITITNYPDHGDIEELGDGFISYTPFNNFAGEDSLVYRLCNLNCAMMCDTAVVKFNISGVDFANDCFIPNILTPNDDGMNDALMVSCASQFPDNQLKVYNRWGDLVYETEGYNNTWKGTYKDQPLPAGTYFFLFKRDPRNEFYEQGYLTIFR